MRLILPTTRAHVQRIIKRTSSVRKNTLAVSTHPRNFEVYLYMYIGGKLQAYSGTYFFMVWYVVACVPVGYVC